MYANGCKGSEKMPHYALFSCKHLSFYMKITIFACCKLRIIDRQVRKLYLCGDIVEL